MNIEKFIEKAIEGGWNHVDGYHNSIPCEAKAFLDPLAWQAAGKVEGWPSNGRSVYKSQTSGNGGPIFNGLLYEVRSPEWFMHGLMDALLEGKSIEQFLETL